MFSPYAFASQTPSLPDRMHSSSGGIFGLLAKQFLADGGIVYGAAFNNRFIVEHVRVDKESDLPRLYGSKYVFSKFAHIQNSCKTDLDNGKKVLFTGTPCQIASLRNFLERSDCRNQPLYLELICHGAPHSDYWKEYLKAICKTKRIDISDIKSINFRDKSNGWKNYNFELKTSTEVFIEPFRRNVYMQLFLGNLTLRQACFRCPFKGNGSRADIILGDLWGSQKLCPDLDDDTGLSVVVVRTQAGMDATKHIPNLRDLAISDIAYHNPSLISNVEKPLGYDKFRNDFERSSHKAFVMKMALCTSLKHKAKAFFNYYFRSKF